MATQTYVNAVTQSDAAEFNKFDTVAYAVLSGVAGTNTITATGPANYTYSAATPPVWFIPAVTNTAATTINITPSGGAAGGAKNVFAWGAACVGGELVAGRMYGLIYDGTQYHIIEPSPIVSTFTATLTGCTTAPTYTVKYTKIGNVVTLIVSQGVNITATSNATGKTLTGMPAAIRPSATVESLCIAGTDNGGTPAASIANITAAGVIDFGYTASNSSWTNSGTFRVDPFVITYTTA